MKKITILSVCFLFVLSVSFAQSQRPICGTSVDDQLAMWPRLQENVKNAALNPSQDRAITYVPVHFHLTKKSNGSGRASYASVLEALCGMNESYASHDIQFYFSPSPTDGELWNEGISSDGVHIDQSNSFLMQLQKHPKAMNIYVASEAASGSGGQGITLAYYSPSFDWIVTRKDQLNRISETLPHEAGHFFSLMHTFFGWENPSFTPSYAGWPIAPVTSPGGVPTERVNGTNCTTAGDGICDTPPDYNFGILAGGCQPYTGGAKDPLGVAVDPMENNIMSYYSNCPDWMFTAGQSAAMKADIASPQRNYLDNTFQPVATTITTPSDLIIAPANNSQTVYFNDVDFTWKNVAGASHYLVDIDIIPNFLSPNAQSLIVEGNTLKRTDLVTNKKYYLRVRPFNYYYTCTESQSVSFFTNDTPTPVIATKEIKAIENWTVSPNPVTSNESVSINVRANESFEASIMVLDMAGKVVYRSLGHTFGLGNSTVELAVDGLSNGFYFVKLDNGTAIATKKLVVIN